jgi:hypothetical protein
MALTELMLMANAMPKTNESRGFGLTSTAHIYHLILMWPNANCQVPTAILRAYHSPFLAFSRLKADG